MTDNRTPWHTDRWFTSPWNHDDEVAAAYAFPEQIQIHDVTLRDGEQQASVVFTADDKVRIAERLAEAGIHRIEAGLPAVSEADTEAVRRIAGMGLPSQVYAFSRCIVDDVKRAVDCGVEGVVLEIPSSRHLIELGYGWSVERALELSVEATNCAHDNGLSVTFFPIDATRASVDDYLALVDRVATDGHLDALALVDTFGVLTPHAVERFVRVSRERFGVPLETHFHMDYGLGVANSLIAIAAGASVMQGTVSGLGERAGNTPFEEVVLALLTMYDIDIGVRTEKLTELAEFVADLSDVRQPSNRPVTGNRLFDVESGIIATWVRNARDVDRTEVVPYLPELVGQSGPTIVLGKGSGVDNVAEGLERIGVEVTAEQGEEILQRVKRRSLQTKGLLDDDDLREIATEVVGR
ncbi:MAG: pyruvate carboxyltransferase [Streptosporangiales bacterium]|nr:pyruvate carboxyltransferase [Streptosporangiales bacterium]